MNHPLPPCILCGHTDGRAAEMFFALALLVLFVAPVAGDGYYTIPRDALDWLNNSRRALAAAEMTECVYCDKAPPTPLLKAKVPALERAAFYTGDQEWTRAETGTQVDLAELFRLRVEYLREAEARRTAARSEL